MKKSGSTCLKVGLELVESWKTKKRNPKNQELRLNKLQIAFCGLFWYNILCYYLLTTDGAIL